MSKYKVAILTQPLGHNYGGLLQAYALQTYLRKLGYDVETLDRRAPVRKSALIKEHVFNLLRLVLGRIKSIPTRSRQTTALSSLIAFRDRRLTMSPTINNEHEIRNYFRAREFNAVLVGSDQVWRPRYSPSIPNFYLDFLDDIKSPANRLAYAASFGVDDWEYTDELTKKCKELAQQFDAVSVRESSAVDLCKDKLSISAKWVVDPTLLLEPSDYDQLIETAGENKKEEYVLSYVLDPAREKRSIADAVGKTLGVKGFAIKPEFSIAQVRAIDFDKCRFPSVEDWLKGFRDARFIVTDSFHGTIFSILFNKPFVAVGNPARGMARFESLLSQFGLGERLVESSSEIIPELIHSQIDWEAVNRKRRALAVEGQEFLKSHLSDKY